MAVRQPNGAFKRPTAAAQANPSQTQASTSANGVDGTPAVEFNKVLLTVMSKNEFTKAKLVPTVKFAPC
jgi:hypothetical protein